MGLPAEDPVRAAIPGHPLTNATPQAGAAGHALPAPTCATARDEARAGLYVHVPFCATRCTYCDFSSGSLSAAAVERYLEGIAREVDRRAPEAASVRFTSVFFGGGTPSALSSAHFRRLWSSLRAGFDVARDAEITLEANPESTRDTLLETWAACGVNRLSFGAQSFVAEELEGLGRLHDAERPGIAIELARRHGFQRTSIDLMFGFPGHTLERWAHSIDRVLELDPGHVSAYCFIPERGTPLGDAVASGRATLPSDDEQAESYAVLEDRLGEAGYAGYETSNFCRPGNEARHNLVYWLRRPYAGVGPSAHGLMHGRRYGNHYALDRWAGCLSRGVSCEDMDEPETSESRAREIVMLALRLGCGFHPADYDDVSRADVERHYGSALRAALATGRLERCSRGLRVAPRHRFVADDVIAWIEARGEAAHIDSRTEPSIISGSWHPTPYPAV